MDNIFESLKTFDLTQEDLDNNTIVITDAPWNKGMPAELQPNFGKKFTKEHREKIAAAHRGKLTVISPEQAKKISMANKGRPKTYVTRLRDKKVVDVQNFYRHP